jgi:predicted  nucleic acid-binding Zn-ribbon protein
MKSTGTPRKLDSTRTRTRAIRDKDLRNGELQGGCVVFRPLARFSDLFGATAVIALLGLGCDLASSQEARQLLETGREVRTIEKEEIEPRLTALEALREQEIEPREGKLDAIERQIEEIRRGKIEPLIGGPGGPGGPGKDGPGGDPMPQVFKEFEQQMQKFSDEERALERRSRELSTKFQDQQRSTQDELAATLRAKEDRNHEIGRQMQKQQRDGRAPVEDAHRELQQIDQQLSSLAPDSPDAATLRQRAEALRNSVGQLEQQFRSQVRTLEDEMNALNDELRVLYRGMDDQMRSMQTGFEQQMRALEQERFALNDRRFELEKQMRDRIAALQAKFEAKHQQVEAQVMAIQEQEIKPLEAEAQKIELELRDLYPQEKKLTSELRAIRDDVQSKEGQMEDRMLDLLERAIDATPVAGEAAAAVSGAP